MVLLAKKGEKEKVNLLIRDLSKDKEEIVRTTLNNIAKLSNEEWTIEEAPKSMLDLFKYFAVLESGLKRVENGLNNLRSEGFNIGTKEIKNILKLRDEHLFSAIAEIQKKIRSIQNTISQYEPKLNTLFKFLEDEKKETEKPMKLKKRVVTEFMGIKGIVAPRILEFLYKNKSSWYTSDHLAKKFYGKSDRDARARVTQTLKQHKKLINIVKKSGLNYYRWKE